MATKVCRKKLLGIINNDNNNRDRKNLYIYKKKKPKKVLISQQKIKSKREEIKKSLKKPTKNNLFKSKIKKFRKIFYDSKINGNRNIEEIKKILYDPKNNVFKPEEGHYKPIRIGNAFSSDYIEYKSNEDKDKLLPIKEYLNMIRPYLNGIKNDNKIQGEWKIYLTMAINAFSSKDSEETRTMYIT